MIDRLYENMLELIRKRQKQDSNSTLCNLNFQKLITNHFFFYIVIVHYVI